MPRMILVLGLLATIAVPSLAESATRRGNDDLKRNCAGDAVSFCSDISPDDPAMNACFKKNMTKLSKNCQRAIKAYRATGRR